MSPVPNQVEHSVTGHVNERHYTYCTTLTGLRNVHISTRRRPHVHMSTRRRTHTICPHDATHTSTSPHDGVHMSTRRRTHAYLSTRRRTHTTCPYDVVHTSICPHDVVLTPHVHTTSPIRPQVHMTASTHRHDVVHTPTWSHDDVYDRGDIQESPNPLSVPTTYDTRSSISFLVRTDSLLGFRVTAEGDIFWESESRKSPAHPWLTPGVGRCPEGRRT